MRKSLQQQISFFLVTGIAFLIFLVSCQEMPQAQQSPSATPPSQTDPTIVPVQLPPLPYNYDALEPYIDAETMMVHHDRHHATYVDRLNEAIQQNPDLQGVSVVTMLQDLNRVPEAIRTAIRNNGGGHLNHTMFWQIMAPNAGGQPTGALAEAINSTFGNFDTFKQQFNQAGSSRFGSGWVWLVLNSQGQLQIVSTANQDSPIMDGLYPVMGNDVWEHAYYLKYQNRRVEYLDNWWNVVNWTEVDRRFTQAKGLQAQLSTRRLQAVSSQEFRQANGTAERLPITCAYYQQQSPVVPSQLFDPTDHPL
ncbi:MAG: superoxide dismutase [Cyanobacteria bacterium CRU_2_1]|nr:superoxide dismutase [Cyanobacteria bacterium RU_5_0]NJR57816.1 superoxide dismutase [Cyanobacteria bacterium CRU_2_1]